MKTKALLGFLLAATLASRLAADTAVDTVFTNIMREPEGLVATLDGSLYVTDGGGHRIVKYVTSTSTFSTLAGLNGVSGTNCGTGSQARFFQVEGMVAARGGLVVADSGNQLIRFVSVMGVVTNLAGAPTLTGSANGPAGSARFRYPLGLAVDTSGNIFIADSKNNAIRKLDTNNVVSTVVTGFLEPAAVTIGANGDLWVADTRRHLIQRVDSNGVATVMAGDTNNPSGGYADALLASEAQFNNPRGLLWMGTSSGLLISDTGNNVIRRLSFNDEISDWSVDTYAGVAGAAGLQNGPALSALFSAPVGLIRDPVNGGFFVADRANKLVRRITTQPVQPPVSSPRIGYVTLERDTYGILATKLNDVTAAVFNNPVVIAILSEAGTQTYFTYGATPQSEFEDNIPTPGPLTGSSPPAYADDQPPSAIPSSLVGPQPDLLIKAIGSQDGRRSSSQIQARFQFKAASPSIQGDNAAFFTLQDATDNAQMFYTIDGSDPTNDVTANPASVGPKITGDVISLVVRDTNITFKVRAYRANFTPSDASTQIFTPGNFVANTISFGFETGEASSAFVGSPGQRFYAPITLSVVANTHMYSLQFNVVATNLASSPPVDGKAVSFRSMLLKPIPGSAFFTAIPPAMVVVPNLTNVVLSIFTNLLVTNATDNLLGVGWVERAGFTFLYDTTMQDLITYSGAHDSMFHSSDGKVVVGGYSFVVPAAATNGQTYRIQIGRPSATADGASEDVYIAAPTNGALSALKTVTVGTRSYLVGDAAPFRWFNAGDFGDTNLVSSDVVQVFQSAIYSFNYPTAGSDYFDGMDSCCGGQGTASLFLGNDKTINDVVYGDGKLDVADVFVTFRRSIDPTLDWIVRYWTNGVRGFSKVPNAAPTNSLAAPAKTVAKSSAAPSLTGNPSAVFSADDVVAGASRTVSVPIRASLSGGLPVRVMMLNLTVEPLDGSPALTVPVQFSAAGDLGTPGFSDSQGAGNFAGVWLNNGVNGISGSNVLGLLTITLPTNVTASAAYLVRFDHLSASPNGLGVFPQQLVNGVVTVSDRSGSSWGDRIPDVWRLRYFGSVSNLLSAAGADADGDGVSNWMEYRTGTDPNDISSKLQLATTAWRSNNCAGLRLNWPTVPKRSYVLETSTLLGGTNWQAVATNLLGDGTPREFIDTNLASGLRFYRVRIQE